MTAPPAMRQTKVHTSKAASDRCGTPNQKPGAMPTRSPKHTNGPGVNCDPYGAIIHPAWTSHPSVLLVSAGRAIGFSRRSLLGRRLACGLARSWRKTVKAGCLVPSSRRDSTATPSPLSRRESWPATLQSLCGGTFPGEYAPYPTHLNRSLHGSIRRRR